MRRWFGTLRARLLLSHLVVVAIGAVVVLLAGRRLGTVFVDDHLRAMGPMMRGVPSADTDQLEAGISSAFNRALWWAVVVSALAALAAASVAAGRVLRPLQQIRSVAGRLATGSYAERVPVPAEEELAALAADVNSLAAALDETEQRRIQLVSEVAHELRTPVATLKGYLEGLLDGIFEADSETLAAAIHETERMERLSADLSSLSQAEQGRIDLRLEQTDLGALAGEVAERLRPQFEDEGVALTVAPGPRVAVVADRDRIVQVLTNLIGNALSYTPAGGRVSVKTRRNGDTAVVEITDTGRGLDADQLTLVFERFYRADRSLPGGTGIGLTIARSLARAHGGDVTARSAGLGKGAAFTLSLPIRQQGNPA